MTQCSTQLRFDFYQKRQLRVDFEGGDLTSDAGVLLLREADESLGLLEGLAAAIEDWRDPNLVHHPVVDLLRQRVFQIAEGYEDADDCDALRSDPAFKIAAGRLPKSDEDLASQPTMSRLENRVTRRDLSRIRRVFVERFIALHDDAPRELILDIDGWDDPTHGAQQLTFFHGYFDQYMYFPVQISDAKTGLPLVVHLRPGNSHSGKGVKGILAWLIWRLRKAWPEVKITIRGDSGFALPELMRVCERLEVDYIFGIARNAVLERLIEDLQQEAKRQYEETREKVRLFGESSYAAKTWRHPRRVIMKAEHLVQGPNSRFVVTNRCEDAQHLYDRLYVQRGEDCENRIKELKRGLFADRLSCHAFQANQFRLFLYQAAYWIMIRIRQAAQGTEFERAQVPRLREQLLKLGARIRETVRRVWVHIASSCPWQPILDSIIRNLHPPPPLPP